MNVHLITGPAGSGKSTNAIKEFAELLKADPVGAVSSMRYVVPTTRVARAVEQRIMAEAGLSGIMGNVVCTFYGLAEDIIAQSGRSGSMISDVQRMILLRDLVDSSRLSYLKRSANYPGFVSALGQIIGELKLAMVQPVDLKQATNTASGKVSELAELFRKYQMDVLMGHNLHDREGLMSRALEHLDSYSGLKTLVLDGFGELNGVQREFVRRLAASTDEMTFLLDYDADRPEVFGTVEAVRGFVLSLGATELAADRMESRTDALRHVEQGIFRGAAGQLPPNDSVRTIEGGSPHIEVELIAEEIRRLVRDYDYSFGEIALVGRDITSYRTRAERVFTEFEIPLDPGRKPLSNTALARTLFACLSVVQNGWERADVVCLLKSEYLRVDEDSVRKAGLVDVRAKQEALFKGRERWFENWSEDDDLLDFRTKTLQPVADFEDELNEAIVTKGRTAAVHKLVEKFKQRESGSPLQGEDSAAVLALSQIGADLDIAANLLDKKQDLQAFIDLLRMSIIAATVPTVRMVGESVSLLSTNALGGQRFRAVFVVGLLEKVFPRQVPEDSFLRDEERKELNKLSDRICLSLTSERQDAERLAFYNAISSATERLYLCYPLADAAAKDSLPSFYVDEVRKLFSDEIPTSKRDVSELVPSISSAECRAELMKSFAYTLANMQDESVAELAQVYGCLSEEDTAEMGEVVAAAEENQALLTDPAILDHLSHGGRSYKCTELEAYAACPFMHFCRHTLRLDEVQEEVGPLDEGILLHNTLYQVFTHFREREGHPVALADLDMNEVLETTKQMFDAQFDEAKRIKNLPAYEKEIVRRNLHQCLRRYLLAEYRNPKPGFVPEFFELQFGMSSRKDRDFDKRSERQPLEIDMDEGLPVRIVGKMDRLDVSGDGAMVIDYKLGSSTDIRDFEKGLVLQAMVYALAVRDIFGMNPVATEYRPLRKWEPKGYFVGETGPKNRTFSAEEFADKLEQCKEYVRQIAKGIRCGAIAVEPKECKKHCTLGAVCRIDAHKKLRLGEADGSGEEAQE